MSKLEIDGYDLTARVKSFMVHCKDCDGTNTEFIVHSREGYNIDCYIWCLDCEKYEQLTE